MPRPRPPGWVAPPEKHEEGTRRADRIVGKEVVNRKLQIYLMRRAEADAVAAATINADRSPDTLLGDDTPVDLSGSTPELGDRRMLAKKRGCNPKKNTSCCRTPRRTPTRAAPPATHRGQRI